MGLNFVHLVTTDFHGWPQIWPHPLLYMYEIEFCGVKFSQIEANLRENFTP